MMEILREDVNIAGKALEARDTPYRRRNFVRTFGAMVEGHTSILLGTVKEMAGSTPDWPSRFTDAEMALIRGESYRLTGAGEATTATARLPKLETFLFSLQMYAKWYCYPLSIRREGHSWESFRRALKLRDQVTHPGTAADLEVTPDDLNVVAQAVEWWAQMYDTVVREAPRHFSDSLSKLRKATEKMRSAREKRDALEKRRLMSGKAGAQLDGQKLDSGVPNHALQAAAKKRAAPKRPNR
jgi:hypothetical protein